MKSQAFAALIQDRDAVFGRRFDERIRAIGLTVIPMHLVAIYTDALITGNNAPAFLHAAMAVMAWMIVRTSNDGMRTIIFSHVYWTFSFVTYAYAAAHGQSASHGLGDPERSASIALVSQSGLFIAFLLLPTRAAPLPASDLFPRRRALQNAQWGFLVAGFAGIALQFAGIVSEAVAFDLTLLIYAGLALRIAAAEARPLADPILCLVVGLLLALSIYENERTGLFAVLLLVGFATLITVRRLFTMTSWVIVFAVWRLISTFSALAIAARAAADPARSAAAIFLDNLLTLETLRALFDPFAPPPSFAGEVPISELSGFHSDFLADGISDLFGRFALLPQMDIVVSRIVPSSAIRWGDLWTIFLSAFPSFGQAKELIFSDRIVWDLGLRSLETIGRPMITAEGELYAIGGYLPVLLVIPVCFTVLYAGYCIIARISASRIFAILITSQFLINTVFSTTILSLFAGTIRLPLQIIAALAVGLLFAASLPSGNDRQVEGLSS